MRTKRLWKPFPIFLILWVIGYVIWAFYVPPEWDNAVMHFLSKIRVPLDPYRSVITLLGY